MKEQPVGTRDLSRGRSATQSFSHPQLSSLLLSLSSLSSASLHSPPFRTFVLFFSLSNTPGSIPCLSLCDLYTIPSPTAFLAGRASSWSATRWQTRSQLPSAATAAVVRSCVLLQHSLICRYHDTHMIWCGRNVRSRSDRIG